MKLTQGSFSYLPELDDAGIGRQIDFCLSRGWSVNVEFTDDPHPRNVYWEMWCAPHFDAPDSAELLEEIHRCRVAHPNHYVKVNAFDSTRGRESIALSFLVHRPEGEPGFRVLREEAGGRRIRYGLYPYATDRPAGDRYGGARSRR